MKLLSKKELEVLFDRCLDFAGDIELAMETDRYFGFIYEFKLKKCESPIEQIMLIFLQTFLNNKIILPQYKYIDPELIDCAPAYRFDFLIYPKIGHLIINKGIIIECDGKDFHDTDKTFQRDRERERYLTTKGFYIFRYSGKEIYKFYESLIKNKSSVHDNPYCLMYEIDNFIEDKIADLIGKENIKKVNEL